MDEHAFDHEALAWAAGWLVAVVLLFVAGTRLPLETHFGRWRSWLYGAGCVAAGVGVWVLANVALVLLWRSEEHTSELQSLMRSSYAVFCLKKTSNHESHRVRRPNARVRVRTPDTIPSYRY